MKSSDAKLLVEELVNAMPNGFASNAQGPRIQLRMDPERFRHVITALRAWAVTPITEEEKSEIVSALTELTSAVHTLTATLPT